MEKDNNKSNFKRIIPIAIEEFVGQDNVEFIEVISPSRSEKISVIDHLKFRGILREKGIIPYGEDLDEDFQNLLWLSASREDLLMLRKIKKILNDIRDIKYFKNYGMYFREESMVDSDYEAQDEKPNMTIDKLLNESLLKKDLNQNNISNYTVVIIIGSSDSFDAGMLQCIENSNPFSENQKESKESRKNEIRKPKYVDLKNQRSKILN